MKLNFTFYVEEGQWTASCHELPGLVTCAKSPERLMEPMIWDAVCGWLDALKKRNQLKETLVRLGVDPTAEEIGFAMSFHPADSVQKEMRYALGAS